MLGRLKFDLDKLANEILDIMPEDVFTSNTSTFIDPAMGGGQFIKAVITRLRKYGHSDKNITSRVFGYETNKMCVNFAKKQCQGVSTFTAVNFLEWETDMKFDVVLGNPPYQSGNGESGGRHSLWRKIIAKSFTILNKNGYIAMVCPGFPLSSNDLGTHIKNNTPVYLNNDVSEYFPGIGSDIKSWIIKEGKHNNDFIVDGNIWTTEDDPTINPIYLNITKKLESFEIFDCKYDGGYNSTQLKNDENDYFETPTGDSIYPIRHGSTVKVAYVSKPTHCHNLSKVMMTFSGYPGFKYSDKNNPMSSCLQMSGYIKVSDHNEGESLINLYSTKLYTFLSSYNSKGMRGRINYSLPKLPLDRAWTDIDLYNHFGLTQEEIDYIEANVK